MMFERAEIFREANERLPGTPGLLAAVIGITSDMLASARANEWASVTADEVRRRTMLEQCFAEPVKPEYSEVFAEALAVLLHMNEELTELLTFAKGDLLKRLKPKSANAGSSQTSSRSIGHYLDVKEAE